MSYQGVDASGMKSRTMHYAWVVLLYVIAHETAILLVPTGAFAVSSLFQGSAELMACHRCVVWAARSEPSRRPGWIYIGVACFLTAFNTAACYWFYALHHGDFAYANITDFFYLFNYVTLVLAVLWSERRAHEARHLFLDVAQAAIGILLGYLIILGPGSALAPHQPVAADDLVHAFGIMNLTLASYAVVRCLAQSRTGRADTYEQSMVLFVAPFLLVMCLYNLVSDAFGGVQDVLIDVPFLILWARLGMPEVVRQRADGERASILVNRLGPVILAGAVIALGLAVSREQPLPGTLAIFASLLLFAVRGALSESRYILGQQALEAAQRKLEALSLQDGLTSVGNRRRFDIAVQRIFEASRNPGTSAVLVMLDVDHFKNVNDVQGHQAGDECLIRIASVLRQEVTREADVVARYGGEEFAVLLPNTGIVDAARVAERMRASVETLAIPNAGTCRGMVTISIGMAALDQSSMSSEQDWIKVADAALYAAKEAGRNKVVVGE